MIKRLSATAAAIGLSTILAGCLTVNVPEGQFFYPDTRVQAEKLILVPGPAIPGAETLSLLLRTALSLQPACGRDAPTRR